jgi:aspartate aminotransferase-like enzyme
MQCVFNLFILVTYHGFVLYVLYILFVVISGYHTTMPTDALRDFHEISVETMKFGIPELKEAQLNMGRAARDAVESKGLTSVAAPGFEAPGVLVFYSPTGMENPTMMNKFKTQGLQIAMVSCASFISKVNNILALNHIELSSGCTVEN